MEQMKIPGMNLKDSHDLHSLDTGIILSALGRIKDTGNTAYLHLLFDLLASDPDAEVKKEILAILGSIKLKKSAEIFTDAIADTRYSKIRKDLLAACWQNGLDFTTYFPLFIRIVVEADWETAFEAFTVIENSEYLPDPTVCREESEKIRNLIGDLEEKKQYFLKAILAILGNE